MPKVLIVILTGLWCCSSTALVRADDRGIDFFEKKIRPVLVENCYKCHSQSGKKQQAGLLLDSKAGWLKGGESGPVVVPGKPRASLLLKAISYTDPELRMPPTRKLPATVVADFEKWISIGAPAPEAGGPRTSTIDFASASKHWSFQPIRQPVLPQGSNPIDQLILVRLEEKGLSPSPPADRRTLIRRAYYDLIGLPPTWEEVQTALSDKSPDWFDKVVDRLLASPHYGERWGRHWLDVARFADTKDGVLMYGDDRIRPYAYTYRDYVIRAFNEDTPFDRFIHEQLAADRLEPKVESWRLAAMGFLTLGRMFDNNIHDVLDDRIDVTTRGLLGLTVSCARCHDHKYDPIPTADYYSIYGVFASSEAPLELPLIGRPEDHAGFAEFEKQAAPRRAKIQEHIDKNFAELTEATRQRTGDYIMRAATTTPDPLETAIFFLSLAPEDLRPQIVNRWRRYLAAPERANDPVFGPWPELMKCDSPAEKKTIQTAWLAKPRGTQPGQLNPIVADAVGKANLASKADVAKLYGDLCKGVYQESKQKDAKLSVAERQVVDLVTGADSPNYFPKSRTWQYMSRQPKDQFGGMMTDLDRVAVKFQKTPPRAMVLHDAQELYAPRIFQRGSAAAPGESVPRQFLRIVAGESRRPFTNGSGRLDLAKAITAPNNPLTARVLVNRVWMHHFGEPLVANPSDFGFRSSPPSHPELLDWLAATFMEDGWSLKKLHRRIMLTSAYQQASWDRPDYRQVDPENRFLWRAHRRRLDLESMRDTMLAVAGRLDKTMFGRPVDIVNDAKNARRTVYGLVDRQSLPGLYRAFDFASPDQSAERRPNTTVPQQALFGMNSPFMIEQAKALAARANEQATAQAKISRLYRLVLSREPEALEFQTAASFLNGPITSQQSQLTALEQLAQVTLLINEVMFVD